MIALDQVGIQFQGNWIFKAIDLFIPSGESAILIGPSGSGKSVLLKLIAGLLRPSTGKISLNSSNVGMLFQKNALFDSLTVEENLLFPLFEKTRLTGARAHAKVATFLEAVGLKGSESLYPDEISGGMQKRLGIARALIVEPEIILYDEPTAGLDPITSKRIADLIRNLKVEFKSTLIIVTNDMQRAYQIGDRIFFMAQGKLVPAGTPQDIQNSKDLSVRQFIYGLKQGPLTAEFV